MRARTESGACATSDADRSKSSSSADDASFNFHLVAGLADKRRKRGGQKGQVIYSQFDADRQPLGFSNSFGRVESMSQSKAVRSFKILQQPYERLGSGAESPGKRTIQ